MIMFGMKKSNLVILNSAIAEPKTQSSWIDELIKWENAHPEYKPFTEDNNSQRQQNLKETY